MNTTKGVVELIALNICVAVIAHHYSEGILSLVCFFASFCGFGLALENRK